MGRSPPAICGPFRPRRLRRREVPAPASPPGTRRAAICAASRTGWATRGWSPAARVFSGGACAPLWASKAAEGGLTPWALPCGLRFLRFLRAAASPGGYPPLRDLLTPVLSAAARDPSGLASALLAKAGMRASSIHGCVGQKVTSGAHLTKPKVANPCRCGKTRAQTVLHRAARTTIETAPGRLICAFRSATFACGHPVLGNRPTVGQRTS